MMKKQFKRLASLAAAVTVFAGDVYRYYSKRKIGNRQHSGDKQSV